MQFDMAEYINRFLAWFHFKDNEYERNRFCKRVVHGLPDVT